MPKLFGADGHVAVHEEVGRVEVTRQEIIMLSLLHEFAQKHHIKVVCQKCERPFHGNNNDTKAELAVSCQCREFFFRQRR